MDGNSDDLGQKNDTLSSAPQAVGNEVPEPFLTSPSLKAESSGDQAVPPGNSAGNLTVDNVQSSNLPEENVGDIYLDTGENNNVQTNLSGGTPMSQSANGLYPPTNAENSAPQPAATEATLPPVNQPPLNPNSGNQPAVPMSQMAPTGVAQATPNQIASADAPDLNRWNWGAFFLTWIWGIGNGVWISLIALVPGASLIMSIVLGIKGSEWAWKSGKFKTVEEFKMVQKKWSMWGSIFFWLSIICFFAGIFLTVNNAKNLSGSDDQRVAAVSKTIMAIGHYSADNDGLCPQKLSELVPKYLTSVPTGPTGEALSYKVDKDSGGIVSITLKNANDYRLYDVIETNGAIYDESIECLMSTENLPDETQSDQGQNI